MHCSHGLPHGLSLVRKGVRAGRHRASSNDSEGNQNISTSIDMWSKPTAAYRSNTGSHKNRGAGCEVPLPFDMRFEVLLFHEAGELDGHKTKLRICKKCGHKF